MAFSMLTVKKAEANMWWVIIGAVLAVVVLMVLLTFFGRGTETVAEGVSKCESKLGKCLDKAECLKGGGSVTDADLFECKEGVCCYGYKEPKE